MRTSLQIPAHKLRSSRRKKAHSVRSERCQSLLTSAATKPGLRTVVLGVLFGWLCFSLALRADSFVYETATEFITSADVNGDGLLDVIVLDKSTGNARVGYQDSDGALAWSAPLPTGAAGAQAMGVGRFINGARAAIAVTSPELNRVRAIDLANSNAVANVVEFTQTGAASTMLVGLSAPYGTVGTLDWVTVGSRQSDPGITLVELFAFLGDGLTQQQELISQEALLRSAQSLRLGENPTTLLAAIADGSNDTFVVYSFSNTFAPVLVESNLPPGTEYLFGTFHGEPYPRFLFYVPGESNVTVRHIEIVGDAFVLSAPTTTTLPSAVQRVFYVDAGGTGLGVVQFPDGAAGIQLAVDSDAVQVTQGFAVDTFGNEISGFVPLGAGRFALLSNPSNTLASTRAQVFTNDGSGYVQISATTLPSTTTSATRANVWLFASEPFVKTSPGFVASLNGGGDWIRALTGLPGALSVTSETDGGATNGLGNPTTQSLNAPASAAFGIPNQYHPAISLFSYSPVRAAQPAVITISPPPGHYENPIDINFTTGDPNDHVWYRLGNSGVFQQFFGGVTLSSNGQVQYYGTTGTGTERTELQLANYTITDQSFPPLVTTNGNGTNNVPPPPPNATNGVPSYPYGTVFYSRRTGTNGAIWSVTLEGTGDRYITEGTRPRLSPEGRYLAFLRGGRPFDTIPQNNGDIWIRDLLTGEERMLVPHTDLITGFDWEYGNTNLVFDHGCGMFRTDLDGNVTPLPFATLCPEDAPAVSPIDGRLAFHSVAALQTNYGIFVTDPAVTTKQYLDLPLLKPRRPAWSPDGDQLALADYAFTYLPESPMNLYVVNPDGTELHQITGFTQIEGFREGALWTPNADGLIGAATIGGVNGIWIVPLTADRHGCGSPPVRLATTPGDSIDFVGTVFVPPGPPKLFIRREQDEVVVIWRRTAWPYVLEFAGDMNGPWSAVAGAFAIVGRNFEHRIPAVNFVGSEFFRLRKP